MTFTTEAPPSHLKYKEESSDDDNDEDVNLMMRSLMKHKKEEKRVEKRLKVDEDEISQILKAEKLRL